jgi:hypothetical protein
MSRARSIGSASTLMDASGGESPFLAAERILNGASRNQVQAQERA